MNMKTIHAAVAAYEEGASEADAARLRFFEKLFEIQDERASQLNLAVPQLDGERIGRAYDDFEPLLSIYPAAIDTALFYGSCRAIALHLADQAGLDDDVAEALRGLDWYKLVQSFDLDLAGSNPPQFVEDCLKNFDDFGIGSDVPSSIVMMVVSFALRAHVQDHASQLFHAVPRETRETAQHTHPLLCPVCGSPATASHVAMASGIDGRAREMYCSMCGTSWPFERMRCGVCGVENASRLHYFHVDGDPVHRLQNCEECGQYHRVVFEEDLTVPISMEVEDVVMAKLDKIALDPRFRA